MNWTAFNDLSQIGEINKKSFELPVIIFKHSTRCSISAMAKSRLERQWDESALPRVEAYYLDLIAHRDISNSLATELGVYHESPQVIIVADGKAVYDDSHMAISFSAIQEALTSAVG
ncbi:MAG: bacillithiol system redox-active protein YtxJ [Bacteroidota bacterium]